MFYACPRRYYLDRYLGLNPDPTRPGTGAIELGVEVHRALAGEAIHSQEAQELAEKFQASALGRRSVRASRVEREFDFLIEIDEVMVAGQIDLWFEEGGELFVADYKTGLDESLASSYELQLRLYALALRRYAGRLPDRALLYYPRSDRAVEVDLSGDAMHQAERSVSALRSAQDRIEFPINPGEQCNRCRFFGNLCPAT